MIHSAKYYYESPTHLSPLGENDRFFLCTLGRDQEGQDIAEQRVHFRTPLPVEARWSRRESSGGERVETLVQPL